jgi:hypothetical protein
MKGFIVWLIPDEPSGIDRNRQFVEKNGGKLIGGGKAEMQPDGRLKCSWLFEGSIPVPDKAKQLMLSQFTNSLDGAIKKRANVHYEVEFIDEEPR